MTKSIYRFRGSNIENILNFEDQYSNCRTIRLEQNYRSTQNILERAQRVMRNNTPQGQGSSGPRRGGRSAVKTVFSESDEANYVAGKILESCARGEDWRDSAVSTG